jgi:putative alpha-1,2-mannosidase
MELYRTGPGGICGNEDMGSLSSWYVLSALGFYPVCPGQNIYIIGSPIFEEATITLNSPYDPAEFTIKANQVSPKNRYIQSATLNGEPMSKSWITHEELIGGGSLVFEMGPEPNKEWGTDPADIPPSMSVKGEPVN